MHALPSSLSLAEVTVRDETPAFHACAFCPNGANAEYCQRVSALVKRQHEGCSRIKCGSPWRLCTQCIVVGGIDGVVHQCADPSTGLCKAHCSHLEEPAQTEDEILVLLRKVLKGPVEFKLLPLGDISRFEGQPRENFDEEELAGLAQNIGALGQIQPGFVRVKEDSEGGTPYELIDGERRHRACVIAGLSTYKAIVLTCSREEALAGVQYVLSVISNFHRAAHTIQETIDMVTQLEAMGLSQSEIGRMIGKSRETINKISSLKRLHPTLFALVTGKKLAITAAYQLTHLTFERQLALADRIREERMSSEHALLFLREGRSPRVYGGKGRRVRPSDQLRTVKVSLWRAKERLERVSLISDEALALAVENSPASGRELLSVLDELEEKIGAVRKRIIDAKSGELEQRS